MTRNFPWQVFLLGGLRILEKDRPAAKLPYRSQSLLAALVMDFSPTRRERLAGLFFPDLPEAASRARLSDRLWLIKNSLQDFPIEASPMEIAVDLKRVWVDVLAFREAAQQDDPGSWARAISLYGGELLPGHYDDWLLIERENLHLLYLNVLQKLAAHHLASSESHQAIPLLEMLHRIEPYDEGNLRNLLRAYQATGKRGAALALFERYLVDLRNEMGIEPEPATLAVLRSIREQAFPCFPARDSGAANSREDLLQHCRQAVLTGDFCTVRDGLKELRKQHSPAVAGQEIDLLELDLAMARGEVALVRRLLSRLAGRSLAKEVRSIHLALEEKNYQQVIDAALPVLLDVDDEHNGFSRPLLLADLALAKQERGEGGEAVLYANQAINVAAAAGQSYPLAYAHYVKGVIVGRQGIEQDAIQVLFQAASFAQDHGYLPLLALVESVLGWNYRMSGKFLASIGHLESGLSICRDLGLLRIEAEILQELATVYDYLGQGRKSLLALEEARSIYETLGDELGLARNMYHLASAMPYHDESQLDQALAIAGQALAILEKHGQLGWAASVHATIGYIEWLRGNPQECIRAYRAAASTRETLNEMDYIPEMYGYMGLSYLQMGNKKKALEHTTRALADMTRSDLHDIASEIYFAHASVLAALGREDEAGRFFERAYLNLLKYAEEIEDPRAREAFFRRDPTVRRLMAQVYARGLARSPRAEKQLITAPGRPPVEVSLTVDAGAADMALKNAQGAVALRRVRLARLLSEARQQGVSLSVVQLAGMMKVSPRTVQRDLLQLAQAGNAS